jgi:uncharacterized Zn-binding protein involved in type VI secretion
MPPVHRLGDIGTGHGCFPPRPNNQGSPDVFVNGIPVHRQSDSWAVHCCPPIPACHSSTLAAGSSTVFANGLQLARIGDPVACGSSAATGSGDTFAGG